jgi:hypothetical protein
VDDADFFSALERGVGEGHVCQPFAGVVSGHLQAFDQTLKRKSMEGMNVSISRMTLGTSLPDVPYGCHCQECCEDSIDNESQSKHQVCRFPKKYHGYPGKKIMKKITSDASKSTATVVVSQTDPNTWEARKIFRVKIFKALWPSLSRAL